MLALVVRFRVRPGAEEAFDDLLSGVLAGIRLHEPGTLVYALAHDPADPAVRILLEVYRDADALAAHERLPHTAAFLAARDALLAAPVDVERLPVMDLASGPGPS